MAGVPEGLERQLAHPEIRLDAEMAREVIWNLWHMILDTRVHYGNDEFGHHDPTFQIIRMRAYLGKALGLNGDLK